MYAALHSPLTHFFPRGIGELAVSKFLGLTFRTEFQRAYIRAHFRIVGFTPAQKSVERAKCECGRALFIFF